MAKKIIYQECRIEKNTGFTHSGKKPYSFQSSTPDQKPIFFKVDSYLMEPFFLESVGSH